MRERLNTRGLWRSAPRWMGGVVLVALMLAAFAGPVGAQDKSKAGKTSPVAAFDLTQLEMRLRALSPGDRSVNEAASATPGNAMSTAPGSPNDLLWSDMEKVGWTRRTSLAKPGEPDPLANVLRMFAFTDEGAKAVQAALVRLRRQ